MHMLEEDLHHNLPPKFRRDFFIGRYKPESMARRIVKKLLFLILFVSAVLGAYTFFTGINEGSRRSGPWEGLVNNMNIGQGQQAHAEDSNKNVEIPKLIIPEPQHTKHEIKINDDILPKLEEDIKPRLYINKLNDKERVKPYRPIPVEDMENNNHEQEDAKKDDDDDDINIRNAEGRIVGQKLFAFGMSKKDIEKYKAHIGKKVTIPYHKIEKQNDDLLAQAELENKENDVKEAERKEAEQNEHKEDDSVKKPDVSIRDHNGQVIGHKLYPFGMRPQDVANLNNENSQKVVENHPVHALPSLPALNNRRNNAAISGNEGRVAIDSRFLKSGMRPNNVNDEDIAARNLRRAWNDPEAKQVTSSAGLPTIRPDAAFFDDNGREKKPDGGEMSKLREFQLRMGLGGGFANSLGYVNGHKPRPLRPFGNHGVNPAIGREPQDNSNVKDAFAEINRDSVWGRQNDFMNRGVQNQENQGQAGNNMMGGNLHNLPSSGNYGNAQQQPDSRNEHIRRGFGDHGKLLGLENVNPESIINARRGGNAITASVTVAPKHEQQIRRPVENPNELPPLNPGNNAIANSNEGIEKLFLEDLTKPLEINTDCIPFNFPTKEAYLCVQPPGKGGRDGAILRKSKSWEPKSMQQFAEILLSDTSLGVIDIGAGIGVYTISAALMNRKVVAVEPMFANYGYLHKTALENNVVNNIVLVTQALGKESYEGHLVYSKELAENNQVRIERLTDAEARKDPSNNVHVTTLDNLVQALPFKRALLKLDVGGYMEGDILKGGTKFFNAVDIPYIMTHWTQELPMTQKIEIVTTLTKLRYEAKLHWNGNRLSPNSLHATMSCIVWVKSQ